MIFEYLQYPFIQRALIAGLILALLFALLGVFVALRQMAFWGEGIAHSSLAGVAIALLAGWNPLVSALVIAVLFAVLMFILERKTNLTSDALIGVLFTSFMALGVVILSFQPRFQPELMSFLFGNILTIGTFDVWLIAGLSLLVIILLLFIDKQLSLLMFDRTSAYLAGIKTELLEISYYIILAISVVLGVKMLGVLLVSALLILPVSIAKIMAGTFSQLKIFSVIFAEIIMVAGMAISLWLNLPSGPTIILAGSILFILVNILKFFSKKI